MPQRISGESSDLPKTIAALTKELLENNWPTSAYDPLKADIGFGLGSWDNYGDIDIHVNMDRAISEFQDLTHVETKLTDTVSINIFVRKNTEEIPDVVGKAQRKAEEIIKDNIGGLGPLAGFSANSIILRFDGWEPVFEAENLQDVWLCRGFASAIYWRVKV